MSATPPLLEPLPWGQSTCHRRLGEKDCGERATHHIAWTEDMENGLACDEHYDEAKAKWTWWDVHPFGGMCQMPGTEWVASWEEPPGMCSLPISDEAAGEILEAEIRAPQPVSVDEIEERGTV